MKPLFSKRKTAAMNAGNLLPVAASMEPLFFKAENYGGRVTVTARLDRLQWSRFFSKRKTFIGRFGRCACRLLQWSRFFSKRKTVSVISRVRQKLASMEPLFFKAENIGQPRGERHGSRTLQWSRFFSKRKTHPPVKRQ